MNFIEHITALLKKDKRLWSNDKEPKLLKNTLISLITEDDEALLKLLVSDQKIKDQFFKTIDKALIFRKEKFTQFVTMDEFLPDSFTAFKNKIGLSSNGKLLSTQEDVSLVFPYKDCILEGGQDKEDAKRDEIFYNTTLAPDEVDRLKEPKVLTSWKRHDKDGEHKVSEISEQDNLIIKGNNLLALYSLLPKFRGKVKLIYIDPPYNREEDKSTFYNDKFNHSTWLTFMKNRIEIAKELLRIDGMLFISIDDNESAYLKVLCDSIFKDNFLACIAYERSGVSGLGQGGGFLVNTHENILCYAKDKESVSIYDLSGESDFGYEEMKRYNKILHGLDEGKEIGRFEAPSTKEDVVICKHNKYDIETISLAGFDKNKEIILEKYESNFKKIFRNTSVQEENDFQNKILSQCKDGLFSAKYRVSRGKKKGEVVTAFYLNGQVFAWLKDSAELHNGTIVKTNKLSDFWDHKSIPKADLANEGGVQLRRGKKPENLLKRLLKIGTCEGDLVLDFFVGSGTTAATAHKMQRKYIGIEQIDYKDNASIIRLANVIKGDSSGISKAVNWKGGGSFVYCELLEWNKKYMDELEKAKTKADIKKIKAKIEKEAFFRYDYEPNQFDHKAFDALTEKEQKQALMDMLDMNHLYVNKGSIGDATFKVSEEDKKLNAEFYNSK